MTVGGTVYAWGRGGAGQLGLRSRQHGLQPLRVGGAELHCDSPVLLVAAGASHLAAVAEDGAVRTWGEGNTGQLGHGDVEDRVRPTRLGREVFAGAPVVLVACGSSFTMVLTGVGSVYSCGHNDCGQLGHGDKTSRLVFTQVFGQLGGARVVMVAGGGLHSVAVSAEGDVFTWGGGNFGCLGHNDEQDRLAPAGLGRSQFAGGKIVSVDAGWAHTVALAEDGVLWVWGHGGWGRLGLGDTEDRLVPTRLGAQTMFGGSEVRMAACGYTHTLAVTKVGALWAWGEGSHGRLGLNDEHHRLRPTRVGPRRFAGASIATVSGGFKHSSAVTEGGALYTWGQGEALAFGSGVPGGLGHADLRDRLVPTLVSPRLLGGDRIGRWHLSEERALAFAMGTHARLGAGAGAGGGAGGQRRSRRVQGKAPKEGEDRGCLYMMMQEELVRMMVEACKWKPPPELGEGVARLMGVF